MNFPNKLTLICRQDKKGVSEGRADLLAASAKAKEIAEIKRRKRKSELQPKYQKKSEAARKRAASPEGHANIMKAVAKSVASRAAKRSN